MMIIHYVLRCFILVFFVYKYQIIVENIGEKSSRISSAALSVSCWFYVFQSQIPMIDLLYEW